MEPVCDLCGVVRAVVYCKSDFARLCLNCDSSVHSANALSRRHPRSLLCDTCHSQPAVARCMFDKMSVCQSCDWKQQCCSVLGHKRQALNPYVGSTPSVEFSNIWSYVLDDSSSSVGLDVPACGSFSTLPKNGNCSGLETIKFDEIESCVKYEAWKGQSSIMPPNPNFMLSSRDQPVFVPPDFELPKV